MAEAWVNGFVDGEEIVLLRRDEGGVLRARRVPAPFVSFLAVDDVKPEMAHALRNARSVRGFKREGNFYRVEWASSLAREAAHRGHKPQDCKRPRGTCDHRGYFERNKLYTSYEVDVGPLRRWISDNGPEIQAPRRAYLDIETDSRKTFAEAKKGKSRVLCWAIANVGRTYRKSMVLEEDTDEAERALLEALFIELRAFDQIVAWNSAFAFTTSDTFDFNVIMKRAELLGANIPDVRRWLFLDHLAVFDRWNTAAESGEEKSTQKLENIAQTLLGKGKHKEVGIVPDKQLGAQTWELWEAGGEWRKLMVDYCQQDTDLCDEIEAKTGFIGAFESLCRVCRMFPSTLSLNPTMQVDAFLLRAGAKIGYRFPTKQFHESSEKYQGALVVKPSVEGIGKGIHVVDFSGMYPSIMMTFNMSPETLDKGAAVNGPIKEGCCRTPTTRATFTLEKQGLLYSALQEFGELRKYWTKKKASFPPGTPEWIDADRMSTAYKVARNSIYGVFGAPYSRHFSREIAEGTTQTGVWLIKEVIERIEQRGWKVVYVDTDGAYVQGCQEDEFRKFVEWCNEELFPDLIWRCGCRENHIEIAYEKEFERIVFVGAKKYVGSYAHYKGKRATGASKPEVRGLEFRRGDSSVFARELQGEVIRELIVNRQEDPKAFVPIVEKWRDRILAGDFTIDQIKQTKSIKDLKDYAQKTKKDGTPTAEPAQVQIARILKARGADVREGTRVEFYVRDAARKPVIYAPAEDYDGDADRHYLWEDQVWKPTRRLLAAAFPSFGWKQFDKTRPKHERYTKAPTAKDAGKVTRNRRIPEGQTDLFLKSDPGIPKAAPPQPKPDEAARAVVEQAIGKEQAKELFSEPILHAVAAPSDRMFVIEFDLRDGGADRFRILRRSLEAHTPGSTKVFYRFTQLDGRVVLTESTIKLTPSKAAVGCIEEHGGRAFWLMHGSDEERDIEHAKAK